MYYSAYDLQTKEIFSTGLNCTKKQKCVDDIVNFLVDGEDLNLDEQTDTDILSIFQVSIIEHREKFNPTKKLKGEKNHANK